MRLHPHATDGPLAVATDYHPGEGWRFFALEGEGADARHVAYGAGFRTEEEALLQCLRLLAEVRR